MAKITIPERKGKAAVVAKGQRVKIINTHGSQVVDTWAFNRADLAEFMSMEHTRSGIRKLIPGVGDALTGVLSVYIVVEAWRLGVRPGLLARMVINIAIDVGLGAVPVAGDVFDALWRANLMNVDLIERHVAAAPPRR